MLVKTLIRRALNKCGFDITRTGAMGTRKTLDQAYAHLVKFGFKPQTIIDIGVAGGTPELYRNFRDVFLLLIEPLPLFKSDLESILTEHRGEYVLAAASSYSGTIEFNVHDDQPEGSSIFKETMGDFANGHSIKVATVTVDGIVAQKKLEGPFLIKIDVQGAEIEALKGSTKTLERTEVVVLEVSMFGFMKEAPEFYAIVDYMKSAGFVAYDVLPGWNRPLDNALGQLDILFVKEAGIFRSDHSFSTEEQRRKLFR